MTHRTVCCIGNPNCGKTTLFNALTGSHQEVGNWPGVTVDKKVGYFTHKGVEYALVDLPGIYSAAPGTTSGEDERVARDYLLTGEAEAVINIIDASNLERNLYLTAQLIEMRLPVLVVVNMLDIARQQRIEINLETLSAKLGCPVVGIVASREEGLEKLRNAISAFLKNPTVPPNRVEHHPSVARAIRDIEAQLSEAGVEHPEWYAAQFVEEAPGLEAKLPQVDCAPMRARAEDLQKELTGTVDIEVATARYAFVEAAVSPAVSRAGEEGLTLSEKIDRVVLHRALGIPIFLLVMYVMFLFTQNLGAAFIDFFEILVGGLLVETLGDGMRAMGCPEFLTVLIADGIGGGIRTVSTFIPVVFFLYLFLAVLEDSGYMARAAFVMDRLMRGLGLPGKAFVPLIVGFGCNVPAVMAARTMDRTTDRIITTLMAPFMSCGARLPIYVLFAAAFFPTTGQNLVFGLYVVGILGAVATGWMLKKTALPGAATHFVMEIPPYHVPTVRGVLTRTKERVTSFTLRAGQTIVVIVAALTFMNSLGTDGTFGNDNADRSVLSAVGRTITPVLEPLGVREDNWPAAVGIFTGVFAKEAVIGSLNSLYAGGADAVSGASRPREDESILGLFKAAGRSVVENLSGLAETFSDPLGLTAAGDPAAAEELADAETLTALRAHFGSASAAFAYLLFVLLYTPCSATIAAIRRELGAGWTWFAAVWNTVLAYAVAVSWYQFSNFAADPAGAVWKSFAAWALVAAVVVVLKRRKAGRPKVIPIRPVN